MQNLYTSEEESVDPPAAAAAADVTQVNIRAYLKLYIMLSVIVDLLSVELQCVFFLQTSSSASNKSDTGHKKRQIPLLRGNSVNELQVKITFSDDVHKDSTFINR